MGTAVVKRSVWTVLADNPFPFFEAEAFRQGLGERFRTYARKTGGTVAFPLPDTDAGEIFRVHLKDVPFPEGPGRATLEATAYRAYGRLYVSLIADHDRLFRSLDGQPGGRLYLHDYKFVRSYSPDHPPRLQEVDEALAGFERARCSVGARNRRSAGSRSPLARIRVALRSALSTPVEGLSESLEPRPVPSPHEVQRRRSEVLKALQDETSEDPVRRRIPIKRRRPDGEDPEPV